MDRGHRVLYGLDKRPQVLAIRDETILSSHDTIRIDTKGDDTVIFDTIYRYTIDTDNKTFCKYTNIHTI